MEPACRSATPTRCHEVATVVTNVLLTLLRERAVNGVVSMGDIEKITQLMQKGTISLDEVFRQHEERCRKDHTRPRGNVGARSNPFQRLMVRPFEPLLAGEQPVFPRPYIAHYFDYLDTVLWDRKDELERHCRAIIQALLVVHGNNLTWDHFYSDPRTIKALNGALKILSQSLATPEGHRLWQERLGRPLGDLPGLPLSSLDHVRQTLMETYHGLAG